MSTEPEPAATAPRRRAPGRAQWTLAALIVVFVVGVVTVKILRHYELGQTAAFYIGLPALFALMLTLSTPSDNPYGMVMKAVSIFLLLSMVVLGEGLVCVLFAAPLFYGVGLVVAVIVDSVRRSTRKDKGAAIFALPVLLFGLAALEGVVPALTLPGDDAAGSSLVVEATPAQVEAAVARPLDFATVTPTGVLALGFPRPVADHGGGLEVGGRRTILFDGAHHRPGLLPQHHWGEQDSRLELEVVSRTENSVRMHTVADTSPMSTWLTWREVDISWRALDAVRTEVTWNLDFTRNLDPAWYFGPIEKHVVGRSADYLLSALDLHT
ncbi:hypothetical protein [Rhodococcus kronopolitis]|uniref:Polyketide cyclase / dehydrase and lipid transport n=1 Tax=Rhodococcus kronopolitis TaxID=1460226 RepID=A0ABV9FZ46_9NOCA